MTNDTSPRKLYITLGSYLALLVVNTSLLVGASASPNKPVPGIYAYVLSAASTNGFSNDSNARIYQFLVTHQAVSPLNPASIQLPALPQSIAASPSGRIVACSTESEGNEVEVYRVQSDGALKKMLDVPDVARIASAIAFSANGQFLFVGDSSGEVYTLKVGSDAKLHRVRGRPMQGGFDPFRIATTRDGRFMYVLVENNGPNGYGHTINCYRVGHDGHLTRLSPFDIGLGKQANDMAVDPTGRFLYVTDTDGITTFAIDKNGSLQEFTSLGQNSTSEQIESYSSDIVISQNGRFGYSLEAKSRRGEIILDYYTAAKDGSLTFIGSRSFDKDGGFTDPNSPNAKSVAIGGDGQLDEITLGLDPSSTYLFALDHLFNRVLVYGLGNNGAVLGDTPQTSVPCHYPIDIAFLERDRQSSRSLTGTETPL